ncbi:MAG: peptidyl-prolyl cis-trans isomerase [Thermodesulfovibrionales bacterium]
MKRLIFLMIVVSSILLFSCARQGEQKSGYVAKVGSTTITQEDVSKEMKSLPDQIQKIFEGPEGAERFVNELVKKEILYQEAKKKGLDKSPEYQKKVEDFKKLTLISQLLEKEIEEKVKVSDKDVKDYYESHKKDFTANNQVRASHILVKTEDEARGIVEQVKKGGDFAKIAKAKSMDTGSAKNGGDLGFFSRGQMVPEFENVAFNLKVGEVSGPVRSQYGYHIIKVTERKEGKVVEFEKIKDLLSQRLTAEKQKEIFDSYINNLRNSYKVDINKEALSKMGGKTDSKRDK